MNHGRASFLYCMCVRLQVQCHEHGWPSEVYPWHAEYRRKKTAAWYLSDTASMSWVAGQSGGQLYIKVLSVLLCGMSAQVGVPYVGLPLSVRLGRGVGMKGDELKTTALLEAPHNDQLLHLPRWKKETARVRYCLNRNTSTLHNNKSLHIGQMWMDSGSETQERHP